MSTAAAWDAIAARHGTDKSSNGHGYMRRYAELLADRPVHSVLEVGVDKGASLATWTGVWPDAWITGVDIDPDCAQYAGDRVDVVIGDATDSHAMRQLRAGHYDLIIDDGFHHLDQIAQLLDTLAWRLLPGGLYMIEDTLLRTANWPATTARVVPLVAEYGLSVRGVYRSDQDLITGHDPDGGEPANKGRFALVAAEHSPALDLTIDAPGHELELLDALHPQIEAEHPRIWLSLDSSQNGVADVHRTLARMAYVPELVGSDGPRESWGWYHPDGVRLR